jgi:DNA-binding CsgD family transcriptional regulator
MKSQRALSQGQSQLIELIYSSASDGTRVADLLRSLATYLDADCAQLYTIHLQTQTVVDSRITGGDERMREFNSLYVRQWHALDPRAKLLTSLPMGTVLKCHERFDETFVATSSFYQDFFIPAGFRWAMAGMYPSGAGTATIVSVVRSVGQPAFEDWTANTLKSLLPHFQQASRLSSKMDHQAAAIRSATNLWHAIPAACLFTDEAGRCIEGNEAFWEAGPRLAMRVLTGRVRFDSAELQQQWEAALWETRATGVGRAFDAVVAGGRQCTVRLVPCESLLASGEAIDKPMIAAVFDEQGQGAYAAADLAVIKAGLTKAELEVLAGLLKGMPAKAIAGHRNASVNTVRSQIMAILEKTGFSSQKELIASFGASTFEDSSFHETSRFRHTSA